MSELGSWYFTAPWDPVPVRRGDALGFRAGADYFAELLAPGLSNNTSDARWITLLSWCLNWSHVAWRNAGGGDLSRRDEQRARYAWLRPLELLWVARTLGSGQTTGQLRGRRRVKVWLDAIDENRWLPNFAMSPDQFRRYRQVGTYGAYRVVFRTVSALTKGDGWTPAETALKLAKLVNDNLPRDARLGDTQFENGTKWGHWDGAEVRYWVERGWQAWRATPYALLPTADDAMRRQLPREERQLLEPALFSDTSIRRTTAEVVAAAKSATSHADLCDALANSGELSKQLKPGALAPLPAFTGFADAAMRAMRVLWNELNHDDEKQTPAIGTVARSTELRSSLDHLREMAHIWLGAPGRSDFRHDDVVSRLATTIQDASTALDQLRALAKHHYEHGGGRRWFREQDGKLVPLVADTGIAASDYRFRIRPLCRLAAQCGVADMTHALDAVNEQDADDEEEDAQ